MNKKNEVYIETRCLQAAYSLTAENKTIRQIAKELGVSKSTTHKDLATRLLEFGHIDLYNKCQTILDEHFNTKHIRGGEATRRKFKGDSE